VSIGIACCPEDSYAEEDIIQKADTMLYQAKKEGKNRVCIYNEDQKVQKIQQGHNV